jgi:hypothetical protein
MMLTSSPVPKALLDRLESLEPQPLRRELTSIEREMWWQVILRRIASGDPDPCIQRMAEILATLKARKALRDSLDELA